MTWQTMDTAPKGGRILLLLPGNIVSVGRWADDIYAKKPRPRWRCERGYLYGALWERDNQPNGWLPSPPSQVTEEEGER